jgi:hypothetical protein
VTNGSDSIYARSNPRRWILDQRSTVIASPDLIPSTQSKSDDNRIIFPLTRSSHSSLTHLARYQPQRSPSTRRRRRVIAQLCRSLLLPLAPGLLPTCRNRGPWRPTDQEAVRWVRLICYRDRGVLIWGRCVHESMPESNARDRMCGWELEIWNRNLGGSEFYLGFKNPSVSPATTFIPPLTVVCFVPSFVVGYELMEEEGCPSLNFIIWRQGFPRPVGSAAQRKTLRNRTRRARGCWDFCPPCSLFLLGEGGDKSDRWVPTHSEGRERRRLPGGLLVHAKRWWAGWDLAQNAFFGFLSFYYLFSTLFSYFPFQISNSFLKQISRSSKCINWNLNVNINHIILNITIFLFSFSNLTHNNNCLYCKIFFSNFQTVLVY